MLTKGKYVHTSIDFEKSEYREIHQFISQRGWTLAYFMRNAAQTEMDKVRYKESTNMEWKPSRAR